LSHVSIVIKKRGSEGSARATTLERSGSP